MKSRKKSPVRLIFLVFLRLWCSDAWRQGAAGAGGGAG